MFSLKLWRCFGYCCRDYEQTSETVFRQSSTALRNCAVLQKANFDVCTVPHSRAVTFCSMQHFVSDVLFESLIDVGA